MSDTDRKAATLLPDRLRREQQGLGFVLKLISRSLATIVFAVGAYLLYLVW